MIGRENQWERLPCEYGSDEDAEGEEDLEFFDLYPDRDQMEI